MSGSILTREEYVVAIRDHFENARREFLEWIKTLSAAEFETIALRRWDEHIKKYGGDADLTSRDWPWEADCEAIDGLAYWCFEIERERRGL